MAAARRSTAAASPRAAAAARHTVVWFGDVDSWSMNSDDHQSGETIVHRASEDASPKGKLKWSHRQAREALGPFQAFIRCDSLFPMRLDGSSSPSDRDVDLLFYLQPRFGDHSPRVEEQSDQATRIGGSGKPSEPSSNGHASQAWQGCQKAYPILAPGMTSRRSCPTPDRANGSSTSDGHLCFAILSRDHSPRSRKL